MEAEISLPPVEQVAVYARAIMSLIGTDPEFEALTAASLKYDEDWTCFTGTVVIDEYDQTADSPDLFVEGIRALALKAAVFELTGDENAAEIPIAVPVDEMTHAIIAQPQLLARIAERIGVRIIHQTDQEHTDWTPGDYTDQAYTQAWGERPRSRYWIPNDEVLRRLGILRSRYESIGLHDMGQRHRIVFGEPVA